MDPADELEIGGLVHRPAQPREVLHVAHVGEAEALGMLPDVRRDVLALGGQPRLAPGQGQRGGREHLGVLAVGKRRRLRVADVVEAAVGVGEAPQHEPRHGRVQQRAVRRDAHDHRDAEAPRRAVEAIEHVVLAARVHRQPFRLGEVHDGAIGRALGGGDDDRLQLRDAAGPLDEVAQQRAARHVHQRLAGEPARAHARLHEGGDHRSSLTGRPSAAEALAASAISSTRRPPVASSIGGAPRSAHATKCRSSSTNMKLRSVLMDSS